MQVTTIPPVDPAAVRIREGFDPRGAWVSPRHKRPALLKALQGWSTTDPSGESK